MAPWSLAVCLCFASIFLCTPVLSCSPSFHLPSTPLSCVLDPSNQAFGCSSSNLIIPPKNAYKISICNTKVWHEVWSEINATEPLHLYVLDQVRCKDWEQNNNKYAPITVTTEIRKHSLPYATSSCIIFYNNGTTPIKLGVDDGTKILAGGIAASILLFILLLFLILVLPSICVSCCCIGFGCNDYPPHRIISDKYTIQYRYRPPPVLRMPKIIRKYITIITGKFGIDKPVTPFYIYFLSNHSFMWICFPPLDESLSKVLRIYSTFLVLQFIFLFQNVWKATIISDDENPGLGGILDVFKAYSFLDAFVLTCKILFSAFATTAFQIIHRMLLRKITRDRRKMIFANKENPKLRTLGVVLNYLAILFFIFMTVLVIVQFVYEENLFNMILVYIIWIAGFLIASSNVIITYILYRIYGTVTIKEPDMKKVYKEQYKCYYVQRKPQDEKEPLLQKETDETENEESEIDVSLRVMEENTVQNTP